jgi:hypothetical protein
MNSVKALTIALAMGLASVSAGAVSAATVTVSKQNDNIFQGTMGESGLLGSINVTFTSPTGNRSGAAGGFQMKAAHDFDGDGTIGAGGSGALENFVAFCITPFTWLNTSVNKYEVLDNFTPNLSPLSMAQLKSLGGLAKGAWGLIADKTTAVAFQLAVWEIVAETSGTYDVTKDVFKLVSPSASATLANKWLANLGTSGFEKSTKGLTILTAPVGTDGKHLTQDFVTYDPPAPVPLPGAFGFLAFGLAALVAKGRARRA